MAGGAARPTTIAVLAALVMSVAVALPAQVASAASAGPALSIDAAHPGATIDPDIYGASFPTPEFAAAANLSLSRWGGNSTTRYDYRSDYFNTANDWYFENYKWKSGTTAASPSGLDDLVTTAATQRERAAVTVPVLGWVAKPDDGCGFDTAVYGTQQSTDVWRPQCGNGRDAGGSDLAVTLAPSATSLPFGPTEVTGMAQHLAATNPAPARPMVYQLDNEPSLWNSTHRDLQPTAVSGTALFDKSTAAADAVLAGDPTAIVSGPGDWGWCAYFWFPQDNCGPGADRTAHGDIDLGAAYLKAFRDHDVTLGHRTLSVLDEHFYPQGDGIALSPAGDAATQARRLRSTRALWDPSYVDESWIATTGVNTHVMLLPRMKAWVRDYYPGTAIAVGEYNFGGLESVNGALAQADVLGILGREGVRWAALWDPPTTATAPGTFAFRMFRNLDGHGAGFGTTTLPATSADQGKLSIYAATRPDGTLTAVVVNKTATDLTSPVSVAGGSIAAVGARYVYSAASPTAIVSSTIAASSLSAVTFPANSITTLVLPKAATVVVRIPRSATLRLTHASIALRATTTAYGRLSPGPGPFRVVVQRLVGHTWRTFAIGRTLTSGAYALVLRPTARGRYVVRVVVAADARHLTAVSATRVFTVR